MGSPVVNGAMLRCSFGTIPGTLSVLPTSRVRAEGQPMATVLDGKPGVNIATFGLCRSVANPSTASLTAAALGTLTPGPCAPVTPNPWTPGSATVAVGGAGALDDRCTCACLYGGVIQITSSGTTREQLR